MPSPEAFVEIRDVPLFPTFLRGVLPSGFPTLWFPLSPSPPLSPALTPGPASGVTLPVLRVL